MRPEDQDLIREIRAAMRAEPLALAQLISSAVDALDTSMVLPEFPTEPTLAQLVESLIGTSLAETTAALHAISALTTDEVLAARIRRELDTRRHPMPLGVSGLPDLRIVQAVRMVLPHDVGDDLILAVSAPGLAPTALLVYIDHRRGTLVKDAFFMDAGVEVAIERLREISQRDGHHAGFAEVSLADARAQLEPAIAAYGDIEHGWPPGDTWPHLRPLVSYLVRHLPEGGTPPPLPEPIEFFVDDVDDVDELDELELLELLEDDAMDLAHDFLDGRFSKNLGDDPLDHDLAHLLAFFALDVLGDELWWTADAVELLMTSALPTLVDREGYERAPTVVRAFIPFCHHLDGLGKRKTTAALAAVDSWEPRYHQLRDDPEIVRARIDALKFEAQTLRRENLIHLLGAEVVNGLDADPLPDEPLDLSGVPGDITDRVRRIAGLADAAAIELFDVEMRTACRRLIAKVAVGDPAIFRRQSKDALTAAAALWIVAKANDALTYDGNPTVAELMATFGLTGSPSQRAAPLLKAIGVEQAASYGLRLDDPDLLTSPVRASWIGLLNG